MLKRLSFLFILFAYLVPRNSFSQDKVLDSLMLAFDQAESITIQINALLALSEHHELNFEKSLFYVNEALIRSKANNSPDLIADCYSQKAVIFFGYKKYDSSNYYNDIALQFNDKNSRQKALAKNWFVKGVIQGRKYLMDSAAVFVKKAIDLASSEGDEKSQARYNAYMGALENRKGNNHLALSYTKAASQYYKRSGELQGVWETLNDIGVIYDDLGLYPEALEYYIEAFDIVERLNNYDGKFTLSNNIGLLFHNMEKLEKAQEYYNRSFEVALAMESRENQALILNNLASLYADKGDTLKSLATFRKTYLINKEIGSDCDLAYSCEGIGEMLMWVGQYDSAKQYLSQGSRVAKKCENYGSLTSITRNIGLLHAYLGQNQLALSNFNNSWELSQRFDLKSEKMEVAKCLFEYYKVERNHRKALSFYEVYISLKDSLFNARSIEKIDRMSREYDFKKDIMTLEMEKEAEELKLNKQIKQKKAYQHSMIVVLVLIVLLAVTLGRSYYIMQNHNKKLTSINEEKSTLMGVVAHDLRSPLNNIKSLMSLVKMENSNLTVEQRHYFNLVDETMIRMKDMIDRVLDKSVVDDMKVNLNLRKVDMGEALNIVGNNFIGLAEKKDIQIHFDVASDRHFALIDYNYMIQVYENLLSNAIKFSESDKNIYLKVASDEELVTISIKDEGPGLSKDDLKKLFSKFQQLSAKPTNNEESTGLGLSIVKKFIDAMSGEIRCESVLGEGANFIITFNPFVEEEVG